MRRQQPLGRADTRAAGNNVPQDVGWIAGAAGKARERARDALGREGAPRSQSPGAHRGPNR